MEPSLNRPSNETNELAKERNRAAAERTLTSWIQNCLTLIGFGVAFDRVSNAIQQVFPVNDAAINLQLTQLIGLSTIALGIFLLTLAIAEHLTLIKSLSSNDYLYQPLYVFQLSLVVGSVVLFGLAALVTIVVMIG